MQSAQLFGLSCALALPVESNSNIDQRRLTAHARRLLEAGCSSVTVFGTTGEGASISLRERDQILGALSAAGIHLRRQVIGGVASASVGEAVEQAQILFDRDCRGVLLAPPFYFKSVTDEGLYRWFCQVFEKIGSKARDIYLYHIPSMTQAPLSMALISRLQKAFPEVVVGVKDSGGDWPYTEKLIQTHNGLTLLIGDERHLAAGIRLGAHGAISGLANVYPELLLRLLETGEDDPRIIELANQISKFPFPPAVKALLADLQNDPAWPNVRPPLTALSESEAGSLAGACRRIIQ